MSQENVELFRQALEAYNRRDIEPMLETWHPDAEWYPFTAAVEGDEAYHGREGLRQWWANIDATFEEFEASLDEIRDLGDAVLALGHLHARFRSGVDLDTEIGWLPVTAMASPSGVAPTKAMPRPLKPPGCGSRSGADYCDALHWARHSGASKPSAT